MEEQRVRPKTYRKRVSKKKVEDWVVMFEAVHQNVGTINQYMVESYGPNDLVTIKLRNFQKKVNEIQKALITLSPKVGS
jgi:hypothetical protein